LKEELNYIPYNRLVKNQPDSLKGTFNASKVKSY